MKVALIPNPIMVVIKFMPPEPNISNHHSRLNRSSNFQNSTTNKIINEEIKNHKLKSHIRIPLTHKLPMESSWCKNSQSRTTRIRLKDKQNKKKGPNPDADSSRNGKIQLKDEQEVDNKYKLNNKRPRSECIKKSDVCRSLHKINDKNSETN